MHDQRQSAASDDPLAAALDPLRYDTAVPDVARLLAAGRRARQRTLGRRIAIVSAVAVTATAMLVGLPSSSAPDLTDPLLAAAVAAARQSPPTGGDVQYLRMENRVRLQPQGRPASEAIFEVREWEWWSRPDGTGVWQFGRAVFKDASGGEVPPPPGIDVKQPGVEDGVDASFAQLDLASLPTEPGALRSAIERGVRASPPESHGPAESHGPDFTMRWTTFTALDLLVAAPLRPDQRSALFRVLAGLPGTKALGTMNDPLGRPGQGVELGPEAHGGLNLRERLIVEPETGTVLSSTLHTGATAREVGYNSGYESDNAREVVYLASARVPAAGSRP
jgi:hypothetical protein